MTIRSSGSLLLAAIWLLSICYSAADEEKGDVRFIPVDEEKPVAGSVRVSSGQIYSGMISNATTLAPLPASRRVVDKPDQKLPLRMIDQGYREIYVPRRRAEETVPDVTAWPIISLPIPRQKSSRQPRPLILPALPAFESNGTARTSIVRASGETQELSVAVTAINDLFAVVSSLTHDWQYQISLDSLPAQTLVETLTLAEGFQQNPIRRLEIVRMLLKAQRYPEATAILQSVGRDFPDQLTVQQQQQQVVREELARQITETLEQRRDAGQHTLAANGARLYPTENLTPETLVRVERMAADYIRSSQRMDRIRHVLSELAAELQDPIIRAAAQHAVTLSLEQLDHDSLGRFAAFELILDAADAERPKTDEQLATALSGWLLGAENTTSNLNDVLSLTDARQQILAYLASDPEETEFRTQLAGQIARMEGVSAERTAALIRQLPAIRPIRTDAAPPGSAAGFRIEPTDNTAGALGFVPPEYHQTRNWPLIIAFPQTPGDPAAWLRWWQPQAEKHGFIVVMPLVNKEDGESGWTASAAEHRQVLNLLRTIRFGLRIDDERIYLAGHGVGGEAAMDLMASHAQEFTAVAALSSTGRRHLQWTASNAIEKPWYIVIGDSHPLWFEKMGQLAAKLFRRGEDIQVWFDTTFIKYPERGAEAWAEEADDVFRWFQLYRRQSWPKRLHARLLRSTDTDWGWVELSGLPAQFTQLDAPSQADRDELRPATLDTRVSSANVIRIESAPADVTLFISPELPDLDPARPIRIVEGRKDRRIDYQPSVAHMLERLYQTGDRRRLCYMRIDPAER
ncbi:MAG: hypothetical protein ACK5YX_16495 [Planctomyces sp.]